jgi:hypothetical protein
VFFPIAVEDLITAWIFGNTPGSNWLEQPQSQKEKFGSSKKIEGGLESPNCWSCSV